VHLGHLLVARAAREELALDRMYFVPAAVSPFKQAQQSAPASHRLCMLRLALAGWEWCAVSEVDVERGGVSYSVDTVRTFAARCAGARLFFLIGADNVGTLPQWRNADELSRLVEFVAIPRPGEAVVQAPEGFRVSWLKGWPAQVSSSEVRRRVKAGQPVDHLVPDRVAEFIRNNGLYLC
jgi:nicotinate-nucleotide adenylyltransferase